MQKLDPKLLDILACPKCKAPVRQEQDTLCCQNAECRLAYPIRDGIPIMLIDEAHPSNPIAKPA